MSADDPNGPRASQWLARGSNVGTGISLAVLGVPMNRSITPGSCHLAPAAIRKALEHYSLYDLENGSDLAQLPAKDFGNVEFVSQSAQDIFVRASQAIRQALNQSTALVILGGDNSVTQPGMHALGFPLARCGLITFDAHHDLRDFDAGLTNGNPIRGLLRDGLRGANIFQIGLQPFTNSIAYARVAHEAGITVIPADKIHYQGIDAVVTNALTTLAAKTDVIYVDLDLDVLDRAFAPACFGASPGGLLPWMLRRAARICGAHPSVRAMDLVEIDPTRDVADRSSLAAASFVLAFASGLQQRMKQSKHE